MGHMREGGGGLKWNIVKCSGTLQKFSNVLEDSRTFSILLVMVLHLDSLPRMPGLGAL